MSITPDDVSFLLHLHIRERLLDHSRIIKTYAFEIRLDYLVVDLKDVLKEIEDTRGCHARFGFLERLYAHRLTMIEQVDGDDD